MDVALPAEAPQSDHAGPAIAAAGGDTAQPLNLARRVAWIERLAGPLAGRRLLDCGSGAGGYVRALRSRGADAWGVELDPNKLRDVCAVDAALARRLVRADLERTGFPDQLFDVALLNEVLEHVPDDAAALREVHRVLAPDGLLVVFSPNRLYPFETHGVVSRASGRRLSPWLPGVPYVPVALGRSIVDYWARNYWPWELRARVRAAGFGIVGSGYVWQTFENISGRQPGWLRPLRGALRRLAAALERSPLVCVLGVSQVLVVRKRGVSPPVTGSP